MFSDIGGLDYPRCDRLRLVGLPARATTVTRATTVILAAAATLPALVAAAQAARPDTRQSHITAVGLHNTYEKYAFP
ncbi:hypothetical protein AB0368_36695 [Actinoplanes sp. NPDC051475]|uniref:hypothetical protein n=1 Tax=Actinoplanes sp. NPDC051475 TaxID=3157225 RepID=UPI00344D52FA